MAHRGSEAKKELKKLVRSLRSAGYRLYKKGGHIRVLGPEGGPSGDHVLVRISSTPDTQVMKKIRADLRRAGINID